MHVFALETESHAVAAIRQAVLGVEETPLLYGFERRLLVAGYDPERGCVAIDRTFRLRQVTVLKRCCRGTGQVVTSLQFVAIQSTDFFTNDGRTAAETGRDVEASANREIHARAGAGIANFECITFANRKTLPLLDAFGIQFANGGCAGDDGVGIDFGLQYQSAKADFETGCVDVIIEQPIGPVEGDEIERPAAGQAELVRAVAASVVQQTEQARLPDAKAVHSSPPRSR